MLLRRGRRFASSAARVHALIQHELDRFVPLDRIAVCGFSQGGALALHVSLRYNPKNTDAGEGGAGATEDTAPRKSPEGACEPRKGLAACVALSAW